MIVDGLQPVENIYQNHGLPTFMRDNLITLMRSEHFARDQLFIIALMSNAADDVDASKL